jgi:nucleoside-triphosphatase THEP1
MFRIIAAGLLLATTTAATAQPQSDIASVGPPTIPGETKEAKLVYIAAVLQQMDVNYDGVITSAEWVAYGGSKAGFDILDYNKDDILTLQELRSNADKLRAFADFQAAPSN